MKLYWPMAITLESHYGRPDDPRQEWTYDACRTLEEARHQFDIWEKDYGCKIVKRWIDVRETGKPDTVIDEHVHFGRVKDLWAGFTQARFNPMTEGLEDTWGAFPVCTTKIGILIWFEQTFHVNVKEQLLNHEDEVWSNGNRFRIVKHARYPEYRIWNIGSMTEGYLPLCKKKQVQPFDGGEEIDTDTLLAIRTDGAQEILDAIGYGPETSKEMEAYIRAVANGETENTDGRIVAKMHFAIPWMKEIGF